MERGRYYKQGYRTGKYARRGMIIPEEPLKIRNAFTTLEKQQNSEEESTSQTVMKLNVKGSGDERKNGIIGEKGGGDLPKNG